MYLLFLCLVFTVSFGLDQEETCFLDSCTADGISYDPEKVLRRNFIDRDGAGFIDPEKETLCGESYSEYWRDYGFCGTLNRTNTIEFYTNLGQKIKEFGSWLSDIEKDDLSPVLDTLNVIVVSEDEEYDNWWLQRLRISHQVSPKITSTDTHITLQSIEEDRWNLIVGDRTYILLPNVLALIKRLQENENDIHHYIGFPFELDEEDLVYHTLSAGILLNPSVSRIIKNSEDLPNEDEGVDVFIGRILSTQNIPLSPLKGFEPDDDLQTLTYFENEAKVPDHFYREYDRSDLFYPVLSFGNIDPNDMIFEEIRPVEKNLHLVFPYGFSGFDETVPPHYESCRDTCFHTFEDEDDWKIYDWMLDLGDVDLRCTEAVDGEDINCDDIPLSEFATRFLVEVDDVEAEVEEAKMELETELEILELAYNKSKEEFENVKQDVGEATFKEKYQRKLKAILKKINNMKTELRVLDERDSEEVYEQRIQILERGKMERRIERLVQEKKELKTEFKRWKREERALEDIDDDDEEEEELSDDTIDEEMQQEIQKRRKVMKASGKLLKSKKKELRLLGRKVRIRRKVEGFQMKMPSDVLRLSLIYLYGGFYIDNDALCLNNPKLFTDTLESKIYETNSVGYVSCVGRYGEFESGFSRVSNAFFAFPRRTLLVYYMLRTWLSEIDEWTTTAAEMTGPYYYSFMMTHGFPMYVDKEESCFHLGKCSPGDAEEGLDYETDVEKFMEEMDYLYGKRDESALCIHFYGPRLRVFHEAVDEFVKEKNL